MIVFTEWKGHGPREIEDQVTYPLSLGLRGLRGVRVVRSSSDVGFSMISVIFDDGISPIGSSAASVRSPGSRASGPSRRMLDRSWRPTRRRPGQIFWYTVEGGGLDLGRLRAIQDWYVRPQIGSVPGVAEVSSVGGFPIEYQVAPDLDRLRLRGLTLKDVVDAVSRSNAAVGRPLDPQGERRVRGARRRLARGLEQARRRFLRPEPRARGPGERGRAACRAAARSGWPRSPISGSDRASAAACSRKTATK